MRLAGVDVGSTTVKAIVVDADRVTWRDYRRHNTRQAEKVLEFLGRMEAEAGLTPSQDRVFFTGSGAGFITPLVGGKFVQEVVAVAACVEKLHPDVRFVSEIGGEDMKTIFFTAAGAGKSKQVFMQSACRGGTARSSRRRRGSFRWTLFFSFQDLDATKPAGSMKIRVETITHYLGGHAKSIVEKKKAAMPPGCPLLVPATS